MTRFLTCAVVIGALAVPAQAAITKNGITLLSPKAGKTVPAEVDLTFKARVKGPGSVWVHVCKSKKKNAKGVICNKGYIGQMKRSSGSHRSKASGFSEFLQNPGTYYWQVHRITHIGGTPNDVQHEGAVQKLVVSG